MPVHIQLPLERDIDVKSLREKEVHQVEQVVIARMYWGRTEEHDGIAVLHEGSDNAEIIRVTISTVMDFICDQQVDAWRRLVQKCPNVPASNCLVGDDGKQVLIEIVLRGGGGKSPANRCSVEEFETLAESLV